MRTFVVIYHFLNGTISEPEILNNVPPPPVLEVGRTFMVNTEEIIELAGHVYLHYYEIKNETSL